MTGTINSLQLLRALAVMMVVAYHVLGRMQGDGPMQGLPHLLNAGVDLFFVISGFIMMTMSLRRTQPFVTFIAARILRIMPLYWVASLLWILLTLHLLQPDLSYSLRDYVLSYLLIPYGDGKPILGVGWSLSYEFFFYLVFAATAALAPGGRIAAVTLVFMGCVALRFVIGDMGAAAFALTSPLLLEFSFGLILGLMFGRGHRPGPRLGLLTIAAAWALFLGLPLAGLALPRFLGQGLPMAILVYGACALERYVSPERAPDQLGLLIGNSSYAIYLFHPFVVGSAAVLFLDETATPLAGLAVFLVANLAGIVMHYILERPLLSYLGGAFRTRRLAVDAPPSSGG